MILTRPTIAQRICDGEALFIYKSRVINATKWLEHHPGGALAILHFVGRNASDEVDAYHSASALKRLEKFAIGTIEKAWTPLAPPASMGLVWGKDWRDSKGNLVILKPEDLEPTSSLDLDVEAARSEAYQKLRQRVVDAGLFTPPGPLGGYGSDFLRYLVLGAVGYGLFFWTNGWIGQMASATVLGMFFHQLTFFVHDAGHNGVTGNPWWDRVIGMVVADWIGGLSVGWWVDNHNIHHLVTNHPEHDPDIQHIPFFAISPKFFGSLWSTYYKRVMAFDGFSKTMISVQHKLYYVILALARFNLYANSYAFLLLKAKRNNFWKFEMTGVVFYWIYFVAMLRSLPTWQMRLAYVLVSHVVASPVHVQIVLSHFACSTEDLGPTESFASRQLRTTMDVVCSENVEFLHGGLHLQVTHHLFPRLPRHNLRKASLLVKEYCQEQDIIYREHGFIEGNRKVLTVLEEVSRQIQFLKVVADSEIDEKLQ